MKHLAITFIAAASLAALPINSATAQTIVYSEGFDPAPVTVNDANNIQLGGSIKPTTAKYVEIGQWGLTTNGAIVNIGGANGNVVQPQLDTKANGRVAGSFLDPALFAATGAGTYTLTFDVIPSSTAGAGRVYVGAGSGYDLSKTTDASVTLNIATAGFGVRKADGTLVWAAMTASGGATATHLITTSTEWIDSTDTPTGQFRDAPGAPFDVQTAATLSFNFEYDGSSAIVIAFGGYDTDFKVDNITIATAVPAADTWAGYPITDGYVDTGAFMGWLNISGDPWIWTLNLNKYIYMPEVYVGEAGSWIYIP